MTNEAREIAEAIGKHDAEWIREFTKMIELAKDLTPEQIEACIKALETKG